MEELKALIAQQITEIQTTNKLLSELLNLFKSYEKDYNEQIIKDQGRTDIL